MGEPLLRGLLGADAFDAMAADPALFPAAFDRTPWPFQVEDLRAVLERKPDGKFKHALAAISKPRQNSKSTIASWAAAWRFFLDPTCSEVISVALDRASASIIFNDARRMVLASDLLMACIDPDFGMTRQEMRQRDGRRWLVKSADSAFSRGLRPSMVTFDELGWSSDEGQLFEVLTAAQAAQPNPLCLVVSTVGPIQAGPLWSIFEAAERGDPNVLLRYTSENQSPLVTAEFLERQRAMLPPHVFAREHENTWGAGADAFCTLDDWTKATAGLDPRRERDDGPSFLFCDLGWSHDLTAIAVAKRADNVTEVIALEIVKGSKQKPVVLADVRERIERLVTALGVKHVTVESPQGLGLAQELQLPRGVQADLLYPTSASNAERWGRLYQELQAGTVRLPHDQGLRRELLTLTIRSGLTGWKVEDAPQVHNDRSVACAGAVFDATKAESRWKHISFLAATPRGPVGADGEVIGGDEAEVTAWMASISPERMVRIRQALIEGEDWSVVQGRFSIPSRAMLSRIADRLGVVPPNPRKVPHSFLDG